MPARVGDDLEDEKAVAGFDDGAQGTGGQVDDRIFDVGGPSLRAELIESTAIGVWVIPSIVGPILEKSLPFCQGMASGSFLCGLFAAGLSPCLPGLVQVPYTQPI